MNEFRHVGNKITFDSHNNHKNHHVHHSSSNHAPNNAVKGNHSGDALPNINPSPNFLRSDGQKSSTIEKGEIAHKLFESKLQAPLTGMSKKHSNSNLNLPTISMEDEAEKQPDKQSANEPEPVVHI